MSSLARSLPKNEGTDWIFHRDFREIETTRAHVCALRITAMYVSGSDTKMIPVQGSSARFMPCYLTTGGELSEEIAQLLELQVGMSALSDEFRAWELAADEDMRSFEDGLE